MNVSRMNLGAKNNSNRFIALTLLSALLTLVPACSFGPKSVAESTPVKRSSADVDSFELLKIGSNPAVYKFQVAKDKDTQIFLAPLKECGIVRDNQALPSVIRQLFVGLAKLHIHKQEKIELASRTVHTWSASAQMEESPLELSSYSVRKSDCIVDYVFWSSGKHAESFKSANFDGSFIKFLEREIESRTW